MAGTAVFLSSAASDYVTGVAIAAHIFVGSKAPWDEIAGDKPQLRDGFKSEKLN